MTKIIFQRKDCLPFGRIAAGCVVTGWILLGCAVMVFLPSAHAQGDNTQPQADGAQRGQRNEGGRGMFGGQPPVTGTVTALAADHVTVKTEAGDVYQIFMGPNTQIRKDRQPVKLTDVQTGDMLTAAGEMDAAAKTLHAAFAMDISAEQVKKLREGLGKQWISGKVTAINDTTLTIQRIDNVSQKIEVDENTSFRRGRGGMGMAGGMGPGNGQPPANQPPVGESITLADIKVGDNVAGQGAMKNNVFVPVTLAVMTPGTRGQRRNGNPNNKPSADSPAPAPPQ